MTDQDIIDDILDSFDFNKVNTVMNKLNWVWKGTEEGITTVKELRKEARGLLKTAIKSKLDTACGGLQVTIIPNEDIPGGYNYILRFVVEEYDFGEWSGV
jgi:hypothetical protein